MQEHARRARRPRRRCGGHEAFSLGRRESRHDLALQQIPSTLPASRASRKFVWLARLPAQGTLARFISALLVGGVSIVAEDAAFGASRPLSLREVGQRDPAVADTARVRRPERPRRRLRAGQAAQTTLTRHPGERRPPRGAHPPRPARSAATRVAPRVLPSPGEGLPPIDGIAAVCRAALGGGYGRVGYAPSRERAWL